MDFCTSFLSQKRPFYPMKSGVFKTFYVVDKHFECWVFQICKEFLSLQIDKSSLFNIALNVWVYFKAMFKPLKIRGFLFGLTRKNF